VSEKEDKLKLWNSRLSQWFLLSMFPFLFLVSATLSPVTNIQRMRLHKAFLLCVLLFVLVFLFGSIRTALQIQPLSDWRLKLRSWLLENRFLWLTLLAAGILRSLTLDTMQRWDAGEYYYKLGTACENFDYTWMGLANFRLCGHPTLIFAPIYAIGEFLFPRRIIGMELVNLFLTLLAIFYIHRILERALPDCPKIRLAFYTFLVSCGPLFLGTFQMFNPDYATAIFAVAAIYSWMNRKYYLLFFWCLAIVQSKETGIVVVAGMILGIVLSDWLSIKGNWKEKGICVLRDAGNWAAGITILLQLLYMIMIGGLTSWGSEKQRGFVWNSYEENCFGFQPLLVVTKLKQYFLLNFNWIYTLLILSGLILFLWRVRRSRQKRFASSKKENLYRREAAGISGLQTLFPLISGALFLCVFLLLYITAALVRYQVLWDLAIAMLAVCMLEILLQGWRRQLIGGVLLLLMLIQSYLTVDPVSRAVFPHVETGAIDLLYIQSPNFGVYYGDALVYNHQYTFLDQALDQAFAETYKGGDICVVHFGNNYGDGSQFNGNWWQDWVPYMLRWDPTVNKRVHYKSENTKTIRVFGEDWINTWKKEGMHEIENGVCIFLPQYGYDQEECLPILSEWFEIGEKKTYRSWAGNVDYYELHGKQEGY
jgi:hypothetical protein